METDARVEITDWRAVWSVDPEAARVAAEIAELERNHTSTRGELIKVRRELDDFATQRILGYAVDDSAAIARAHTIEQRIAAIDAQKIPKYQELRDICSIGYRERCAFLKRQSAGVQRQLTLLNDRIDKFNREVPGAEELLALAIEQARRADAWISVEDAAELLNVTSAAIYKRMQEGLESRKPGKQSCVRLVDVYLHFDRHGRRPTGLRDPRVSGLSESRETSATTNSAEDSYAAMKLK